MEKRSIYGLTKGTGLEKLIEAAAMGKAMGVMNHYSLALMAEEQGLPKELAGKHAEGRVGSRKVPTTFGRQGA